MKIVHFGGGLIAKTKRSKNSATSFTVATAEAGGLYINLKSGQGGYSVGKVLTRANVKTLKEMCEITLARAGKKKK